ncbi:MAG: UvrD-helicase domain-containing protein [Verrucomicrobiota bacterium]|jgi:DNA helicase-2/ATP-dependent DNA helicase PcrA
MPEDVAKQLANSQRALVVAPAGCGKTHLISSAVACATGRQLVLTHTHAGVKAICERMFELRVPPSQYHVCTLDSFALRYAAAFPTVSGWTVPEPEGDQWAELLPAAVSALKLNAVEEILRASYRGIFVDEYQDCSTIQHELVLRLACVLPCRVLGDPLQAVFAELNKANALPWAEVAKTFPLLHQLNYPHRWQKKNEALGRWLLDIHPALIKGEPIDVSRVSCVKFVESKPGVQIGQCKGLLRYKQESIVALRKMRPSCHSLAGDLKNLFTVFEDANGEDILKAARTLDDAIGVQRVGALHGLAKRWLTCLPTQAIAPLVADVIAGNPIKVRRPDLIVLGQTLERVRDQNDFRPVADAFDAYAVLKETPTFMSKELWRGITAAARHAAGTIGLTLHDAVWRQRDMHRQNGRHPPRHCLSTPLLVKGLQFDHGVILDAADFPGTEALYVSMTRSSKSLTIVAESPLLSTTRVAP